MLIDVLKEEAANLDEFSTHDVLSLSPLLDEAAKVSKAWSGSWLGYHSQVYYKDFKIPPSGAYFSSEWGLTSGYEVVGLCSKGDWVEYNEDTTINYINDKAGNPDLSSLLKASSEAAVTNEAVKSSVLSIIHAQGVLEEDLYLNKLVEEFESITAPTQGDFLKSNLPKGKMQISTRDTRVEKIFKYPAHLLVSSQVYEIGAVFVSSKKLQESIYKIINYINNKEMKVTGKMITGTKVFIGHGQSLDWRDLKDFINERLGMQWDEFNRVPVAGLSNITRLAEMLDHAAVAFIIMTAEDNQENGNQHARMNVIHEVGLFQGRLGFDKAIVLLEEGCEEFSNIQGLGQIRYPKGNISAVFEDVRQILEREDLI